MVTNDETANIQKDETIDIKKPVEARPTARASSLWQPWSRLYTFAIPSECASCKGDMIKYLEKIKL
jgi:hypothetical protein